MEAPNVKGSTAAGAVGALAPLASGREASSTSKYVGVHRTAKKRKPWAAACYFRGKQHHLGYYQTEQEAARAYDIFVYDNGLSRHINLVDVPPVPGEVNQLRQRLSARKQPPRTADARHGAELLLLDPGRAWLPPMDGCSVGAPFGRFAAEAEAQGAYDAFARRRWLDKAAGYAPFDHAGAPSPLSLCTAGFCPPLPFGGGRGGAMAMVGGGVLAPLHVGAGGAFGLCDGGVCDVVAGCGALPAHAAAPHGLGLGHGLAAQHAFPATGYPVAHHMASLQQQPPTQQRQALACAGGFGGYGPSPSFASQHGPPYHHVQLHDAMHAPPQCGGPQPSFSYHQHHAPPHIVVDELAALEAAQGAPGRSAPLEKHAQAQRAPACGSLGRAGAEGAPQFAQTGAAERAGLPCAAAAGPQHCQPFAPHSPPPQALHGIHASCAYFPPSHSAAPFYTQGTDGLSPELSQLQTPHAQWLGAPLAGWEAQPLLSSDENFRQMQHQHAGGTPPWLADRWQQPPHVKPQQQLPQQSQLPRQQLQQPQLADRLERPQEQLRQQLPAHEQPPPELTLSPHLGLQLPDEELQLASPTQWDACNHAPPPDDGLCQARELSQPLRSVIGLAAEEDGSIGFFPQVADACADWGAAGSFA